MILVAGAVLAIAGAWAVARRAIDKRMKDYFDKWI